MRSTASVMDMCSGCDAVSDGPPQADPLLVCSQSLHAERDLR